MMKKHPPHSLGVFPQGPARLGHGHTIAGEQNHHGFHHQREPRPGPGPGHFNGFNPGLFTALNPRHPEATFLPSACWIDSCPLTKVALIGLRREWASQRFSLVGAGARLGATFRTLILPIPSPFSNSSAFPGDSLTPMIITYYPPQAVECQLFDSGGSPRIIQVDDCGR
jgi:hypothetical protein